MSTGRERRCLRVWVPGFTLLELLVGILLTALLAVGTGPLVVAMQKTGACEADRSIAVLQGRVASARLERDLRGATAGGCLFTLDGPVLNATRSQIVFLGRRRGHEGLTIFEWEIVGTRLMRRWGDCPLERPTSFAHFSYVDNKTMLEGLGPNACFAYSVDGVRVEGEVDGVDLSRVSSVSLLAEGEGDWGVLVRSDSQVGR